MELNEFAVNLKEVVKEQSLALPIRKLATILLAKEYLTIGDWLKGMSDEDLDIMSMLVEVEPDDDMYIYEEASESIVLATLMLCRAESVYPETIEELQAHTGAFKLMVVATSLHRKGLIEAYYDNMSFGDDAGHRVIMKRID